MLGLVLLVSFLVYANALTNGFVYDDHSQIEQNPYVHSFRNIPAVFETPFMSQTGKQDVAHYYRPLVNLDLLLRFKLFGLFPAGFHLINILLHCIVVWLVCAVTVELMSDETFGLVAAVCFALHPIHSESVVWVLGVTDIEMSLFYLLAFWFFLQLGRDTKHAVWIRTGMMASFLLATLSKEPAVTLPVAATAYEHYCRADRHTTNGKQKLSRYAGLWAVALLYLGLRAALLGGLTPATHRANMGAREVVAAGFALAGQYATKLVWPVPLVAFYPYHSTSFFSLRVLLGAAVLIAGGALLAFEWRRTRLYAFALFWIFLTLGLALNVRWMLTFAFAERYLYLPSVGFCWLIAGVILGCWRARGRWQLERRWALGVVAVVIGLLAAREIVTRNRDWKDDRTIALRTLEAYPDSSDMRSDVAMAEWRAQNHAEAIRQWRMALTYHPDNAGALSGLGFAMLEEKNYAEAIRLLRKAISLSPRYAMPHIYLGSVFSALGNTAGAETEFRAAVEIYPMSPVARNALGRFYLDSGRPVEAESEFQASVAVDGNFEAWSGLAEAYMLEGPLEKAAEAWREALALEPYDSQAHLNLGRILLVEGRRTEAQKEFEACLYTDPHNPEALAAVRKLRALISN